MLYFSPTHTTSHCFTLHLPVCLSVGVSVSSFLCSFSPILFLTLSHTHTHTHTHMHTYIQGRLEALSQSRRWKREGAVSMPAELCEWGSDEREAHLVNWQLPSGFFIFLRHEKAQNPSQLPANSRQAWRNCHIPANINNDGVCILGWDPSRSSFPLLPHLVHRMQKGCLSKTGTPVLIFWCKLGCKRKARQGRAKNR